VTTYDYEDGEIRERKTQNYAPGGMVTLSAETVRTILSAVQTQILSANRGGEWLTPADAIKYIEDNREYLFWILKKYSLEDGVYDGEDK
jgi:hypothetical protein